MSDEFAPKIIHIDITGLCNLRCIHCRDTAKPSLDELSTTEIKNLIDECHTTWGKSLVWFSFGGGEPLLREDIFEIIKFATDKGVKTLLTTNGTLIDADVAQKLKNSGIFRVQISLEGASPKTNDKIRGKGVFRKVIKAAKALEHQKIPFTLRMTLHRQNYEEIPRMIKLAHVLGAKSLGMRMVIPTGRALKAWGELKIEPKVYKNILQNAYLVAKRYNLSVTSGDPLSVIANEKLLNKIETQFGLNKVISGCCIGISYLYISNTGKVRPCPMLEMDLGDVRTTTIEQIWKSTKFFRRNRERKLSGKCDICKYKWLCGGCRANALHLTGKLWGDDPNCWLVLNDKFEH